VVRDVRYDREHSDPICAATGCTWDCDSENGANRGHTLAAMFRVRCTVGFAERSPSVQSGDAWSRLQGSCETGWPLVVPFVSRPRLMKDLRSSRDGGHSCSDLPRLEYERGHAQR
jgi:hypothetical protein